MHSKPAREEPRCTDPITTRSILASLTQDASIAPGGWIRTGRRGREAVPWATGRAVEGRIG